MVTSPRDPEQPLPTETVPPDELLPQLGRDVAGEVGAPLLDRPYRRVTLAHDGQLRARDPGAARARVEPVALEDDAFAAHAPRDAVRARPDEQIDSRPDRPGNARGTGHVHGNAKRVGRSPLGRVRRTWRRRPLALMLAMSAYRLRAYERMAGSRKRVTAVTKLAAVSAEPSLKRRPRRTVNVYVRPPSVTRGGASAASGTSRLPPLGDRASRSSGAHVAFSMPHDVTVKASAGSSESMSCASATRSVPDACSPPSGRAAADAAATRAAATSTEATRPRGTRP